VPSTPSFAARVARWQRSHGRHALPWQGTRDPYRIWLSEIMLQQTQVAVVIPYYLRFVERFPDVGALAAAGEDEVLALWSGLGYYARARNLHRAARAVAAAPGAAFPHDFESLATLPGVGRSTAAAIAAFAGGERRAILDGNVRRVLARHAGIGGDPGSAAVLARLWSEAEERLPASGIEGYTQGMMDLGAEVCALRHPACASCPVADDCVARGEGRIAQLPGKRARRARTRRHIAMLVVLARGAVLLEKRPASGVWGGLWSLPEAEPGVDPRAFLASQWGLRAARAEPAAPFEHAFTHFTLEVTPWLLRLGAAARPAAPSSCAWVAAGELPGAALPAPVRRLLNSVIGA
jgi:A/G-specific adenine glycosylase